MSVVGIDLGTRACVIAVLQGGKVDVIANEVSLRQTASCVGFTNKQRVIGEQAYDQFARNSKNTIFGVKALIGRKLDDPNLQQQLKSMGACKWVETANGNAAVEVTFKGETKVFTSEQLLAMLLVKLKLITEQATGVNFVASVISCPGWWSTQQRIALLNAAKIAAIPVLRIVSDLAAIAYGYGFFHPEIKNGEYYMFMDMGYASFGCAIAKMTGPYVQIVAHCYDTTTGGGEIDQLLADHFANGFNKKNGTNLQKDPRGWLKLLGLVEKAKKTLNMNDLATVSMDCISEGFDLSEKITRDEYVDLLNKSGIPQKALAVVKATLEKAGLKTSDLHTVEWVGSTLRAPAIRDDIDAFLGEIPLQATMNAEEAVAIGCCVLCARHSPTTTTRAYDLYEADQKPPAPKPAPVKMDVEPKEGENSEPKMEEEQSEPPKMEEEQPEQPSMEVEKEEPKKEEFVSGSLTPKEVEAFRMDECEMGRQDAYVIATSNAKNELESYVYYVTEQASGPWKEFGSKEEFKALEDVCGETTGWIYGEGADVTKEEYEKKLEGVKVFSEPIRLRLVAKIKAEEDAKAKIAAEKAEKIRLEQEKIAAQKAAEAKAAADAKAAAEAAKNPKPADDSPPAPVDEEKK